MSNERNPASGRKTEAGSAQQYFHETKCAKNAPDPTEFEAGTILEKFAGNILTAPPDCYTSGGYERSEIKTAAGG